MTDYRPQLSRRSLNLYKEKTGFENVRVLGIGNFWDVFDDNDKEVFERVSDFISGYLSERGISFGRVEGRETDLYQDTELNERNEFFAVPPETGTSVAADINRRIQYTENLGGLGIVVCVREESEYRIENL